MKLSRKSETVRSAYLDTGGRSVRGYRFGQRSRLEVSFRMTACGTVVGKRGLREASVRGLVGVGERVRTEALAALLDRRTQTADRLFRSEENFFFLVQTSRREELTRGVGRGSLIDVDHGVQLAHRLRGKLAGQFREGAF